MKESRSRVEASVGAELVEQARSAGADFVEFFAEQTWEVRLALTSGRRSGAVTRQVRGIGLQVVIADQTGYAHTSDLSSAALHSTVEAAVGAARGHASARVVEAAPGGVGGRDGTGAEESSQSAALGAQLLSEVDDAARSTGRQISQVSAEFHTERRETWVVNSEGVQVHRVQPRTSVKVECAAEAGGQAQRGVEWWGRSQAVAELGTELIRGFGRTAADRAIRRLSARAAPLGPLPVVLGPGAGGVLFHEACGHGLEADLIERGSSVFAGRLGQRLASSSVTYIDDGTVGAHSWGTTHVDDEGTPAQRSVLIDEGVLVDYLWDRRRARRAGAHLSGNGRRESYRHLPLVRMTNTFVASGPDDPEAIVADTRDGIYVEGMSGGQVDTATGDFAFGLTDAFRIENGKLTAPIATANLIGNGLTALSSIDAVGNDFQLWEGGAYCGKQQRVAASVGQPTVRVLGLTIGGSGVP